MRAGYYSSGLIVERVGGRGSIDRVEGFEDSVRRQVDPGESPHVATARIEIAEWRLDCTGGQIRPALETHILVEQEITLRLALTHQKRLHGIGADFRLEPADIQVGNNIHIMNEKMITAE